MRLHRITLVLACALLAFSALAQVSKKDVLKRTFTVKGKFVGFETGDYVHAIIQDAKGAKHSYFIGGDAIDYYLADKGKKSGTFKVQVVDSYIEEAGGRMEIERISWAKIGSLDATAWYKAQRKKYTWEQLAKKYDPLVAKLQIGG